MTVLCTARLRIIPATVELLRAEIGDRPAFARLLGAGVPDNWPPESAADAVPWFLQQLEAAPLVRAHWLAWYGVWRMSAGEPAILVGGAGFKGPPQEGTVETGYSVLPQFHGQGFATEMVGALVSWALAQPQVERVVAETQGANTPSVRLLHKLGFTAVGSGSEDGSIRFECHSCSQSTALPS